MAETVGVFEVDAILNKRNKYFKNLKHGSPTNAKRVEYLVQWKGFRKGEETWEPLANLSTALELVREYNRSGKPVTVTDLLHKDFSQGAVADKRSKEMTCNNSSQKVKKKYDPAEFSTFKPAIPGTKRKSTSIYAAMREENSSPSQDTEIDDSLGTEASGSKMMKLPLRIQLKPHPKGSRSLTAIKSKSIADRSKQMSKTQEKARKVVSTILAKRSSAKGVSSQKNKGKANVKGAPGTKTVPGKVSTKSVTANSVQKGNSRQSQEDTNAINCVTANAFYGKNSKAKHLPVRKNKIPPSHIAKTVKEEKTSSDTIIRGICNMTSTMKPQTNNKINNKMSNNGTHVNDRKNIKSIALIKLPVKVESNSKLPNSVTTNITIAKKSEIKKKLVIKKASTKKTNQKKKENFKSNDLAKPGSKSKANVKKRKAAEMDSDSDSDNILYSLADDEESSSGEDTSSNDSDQAAKKKLKLSLTPIDEKKDLTKMTCVVLSPGPSNGAKSVNKKFAAKKMLLKDSLKSKAKPQERSPAKLLRPDTAAPLAPKTPPHLLGGATPFKTPPSTPSGAGNSSREVTPSKGAYNNKQPSVPILPSSPMAPSFESLMKNLSHLYGSGASKRKGSDDEEVADRRVSIRQSENAFKYKEIVVKKAPGFTQIWLLSQTQTKNGLNPKVFRELQEALHNARFDDSRLVMLTGSGAVFCSGVDLHYLQSGDRRTRAKEMTDAIREFVCSLVMFPKPIIAVVNGSAVGFGVSILPLCDIVYASDKASFHCPWARLSQTPEGCASHTFPNVMGIAMASEMILGGRRITAIEACQCGLVSQVFWPTSMLQEVIPRLRNMAQYSGKAMEASKLLIRNHQKAKLEITNNTETQMLVERWSSSECHRAIKAYIDSEQEL